MHASISPQQIAPYVQLRCAGQRSAMALPAGGLHIPRQQNGLLPGQRAAVGFLDSGRSTLPSVTHYAAELVRRVRDHRMPAERLSANVGEAGFFQPDVTGSTAIDDSA